MEIILNEKTYIISAPKARMVRRAVEIVDEVNFDNLKATDLDNLVGYIVDLFNKQFTVDDVYDGLDAEKLIPTLLDSINGVVGQMGAKLGQFPNAQPEA